MYGSGQRSGLALGVVVGFALVALPPRAADWPQVGGPDRNGVCPETGLARSATELACPDVRAP